MDPRDDDIQFDFFEDEPPTTEAQGSRVRLPRRGGRGTGPTRTPSAPRNLTPVLRLLLLIAFLVAVLVFFGLVIQSCASTSKHDAYKSYMGKVQQLAKSSQDDGTQVANALITPGAKAKDLSTKLNGILEQERQNVTNAQHLDAPGPLRDENQQLVEALQLRVSGVQGLATTFAQNPTSKTTGEAAILAAQADRLLASDVVWLDLFQASATKELQKQGVSGVSVPSSVFVGNRDLTTDRSMALLLTRLRGTASGGTPSGVHGTNIAAVKATPDGPTLAVDTLNTVVATVGLGFEVSVHNGGDSQEVGIDVTITIQKDSGGAALTKTQRLKLIDPGTDESVTFTGLNVSPYIGLKGKLTVDVATVPGEQTTSNNRASYPIIFSLG